MLKPRDLLAATLAILTLTCSPVISLAGETSVLAIPGGAGLGGEVRW